MATSNKNSKSRRDQRRAAALLRAEERVQRTPQEQIRRLNELLGVGAGARRERDRLAQQILKEILEATPSV